MTTTTEDFDLTFDRSVDHLGFIRRTLAELSGYRTLAFELIQNADDADDAATIRFDVADDALIVEDDGGFSDCERQDLKPHECPWLVEKNHRCDFHSFRLVSGGDKQARENTTGAFGIGFIAVYQLTDRPELLSGTWHWRVDETRDGDKIDARLLDEPFEGTRIVLPYALDPSSALREILKAPAAPPDAASQLLSVLEDAIPAAILFTRKLSRAELKLGGEPYRSWEWSEEDGEVVITTEDGEQRWRMLDGSFEDDALELRARYPGKIEEERSSDVTVAVPVGHDVDGVLCATLPTEQKTGLPLHINADFYPSSDRRRLEMQAVHHAEWNAAAINAAAAIIADALPELPELLGADRFWQLLEGAYKLANQPQEGDASEALAEIWPQLRPELDGAEIVLTHDGRWCTPEDAVLLQSEDEYKAADALAALGLDITHRDLRRHYALLQHLGVAVLGLARVAEAAVDRCGLDEWTELDDEAPGPFEQEAGRDTFWEELALLASRVRPDRAASELEDAALLPGRDGGLWPTSLLRRSDDATAELFSRLGDLDVGFVDDAELGEHATELLPLIEPFGAGDAVTALESYAVELSDAHADTRFAPGELIRWFAQRPDEVDEHLTSRIAELTIFPSATGVHPLRELVLSGDFTDELGLARLMDNEALGPSAEFVASLGAEQLTFAIYARRELPAAFEAGGLSPERKRRAVEQLALRIGELRDDPAVQAALARTPLAECTDGEWRTPDEVYFESPQVRGVLGKSVPFAAAHGEHVRAVEDLLVLLGCATEPRPRDVVRIVQKISERRSTPALREHVARIVSWAGQEYPRLDRAGDVTPLLPLRDLAWLPAIGEQELQLPADVFSVFQRYLFESQALFLELSQRIQAQAADFLGWLGVGDQPTADLVVSHLLHSAERGDRVNPQVYEFLNRNAREPELAPLEHAACLAIGGSYLPADKVFWGEHPFGRWRFQLGPELRRYQELLDRLDVQEHPNHEDAQTVLLDMAEELGAPNDEVEPDDHRVNVTCWEMLTEALDSEKVTPGDLQSSLGGEKVIVDARGLLMPPGFVFFEDFPGIADRLPLINAHIIKRPVAGWRAMSAAGVRNLSQEAQADLVEVEPLDESRVAETVAERAPQLARVLSAAMSLSADFLPKLAALEFRGAASVTISWSLTVAGHEYRSEELSVPAIWTTDHVWVVIRDGHPVWQAVARELVRALLPGHEPGTLALALATALEAPTLQAAIEALDAAGVPGLADELEAEAAAATADSFDVTDTDEGEEAAWEDGPDPEDDEQGGDVEDHEDEDDEIDDADKSADGADDTDTDGAAPVGGDGSGGDGVGEGEWSGDQGDDATGRGGSTGGGGRRSRLRTYVVQRGDDSDGGAGEDPALQTYRDEVDRAGVAAAVEYERAAGRNPEVMDHSHEGYDIESEYEDGEIARYIEVKSTAGAWDSLGVSVSDAQFSVALKTGDEYWLYVVEHALDPDRTRVHAICDPANEVGQFMFDDGWKGLAEDQ